MTRVIACISSHPKTGVLLQAAWREARESSDGKWVALYVETPRHFDKDAEYQERVLRYLTQAEDMGAVIVRLPAQQVAEGIRSYIAECGNSQAILLFIGNPVWQHRRMWFNRSLTEKLIHSLPSYCTVRPIPLKGRSPHLDSWMDIFRLRAIHGKHVVYAALSVLLACGIVELLRATMSYAEFSVNNYNISILFMLPTVFIASRYGLFPGLITAGMSYFTMNYVYIQPINQLEINDYPGFLNALLFMVAVIAIAFFGSYTHAHAEVLRKRERRVQALFTVNDVISSAFTRTAALEKLHHELTELLEMEVAIFLPPPLNPSGIALVWPPEDGLLNEGEQKALDQSWNEVCTTGNATPRHAGCAWRFEPMIAGQDRIGILAVKVPNKMRLDASFGQLLAALADQTGNVLARIELSQAMEAQRVSEEREKLRSMLLSSVSHDLKTPLASIVGALSVYHGMHDVLTPKRKRELTETALEEAQRLDSFITNILDMTRLESGGIRFRKEWDSPEEMIRRVIKRLQHRLRRHKVNFVPPERTAEICVDVILTEQVLQNLLDNAAKYTPTGASIEINLDYCPDGINIVISDDGPGIPEAQRQKIFDKYERLKAKDTKTAGTGLGLAIVKAIVEGQGGLATVGASPSEGAQFRVFFPVERVRYASGDADAAEEKSVNSA